MGKQASFLMGQEGWTGSARTRLSSYGCKRAATCFGVLHRSALLHIGSQCSLHHLEGDKGIRVPHCLIEALPDGEIDPCNSVAIEPPARCGAMWEANMGFTLRTLMSSRPDWLLVTENPFQMIGPGRDAHH